MVVTYDSSMFIYKSSSLIAYQTLYLLTRALIPGVYAHVAPLTTTRVGLGSRDLEPRQWIYKMPKAG